MSLLVVSLLYLGIMLISAKLAEEVFGRLNLVRFVGPIIVGIILGDGVLSIIKINQIISFITSLGIVFLLFLAGAEELGEKLEIERKQFVSSIIQLSLPYLSYRRFPDHVISSYFSILLIPWSGLALGVESSASTTPHGAPI